MNKPLVTVLMSVYNGQKFLSEAIESILNQTFKDFEFLIINDGSTDSSRGIILSYNDSRIKLIENQANIGLTRSLNKGIDLAQGKYIARMDADDISLPERLEKQVRFMELNEDVAVCGSCAEIINETKAKIGEFKNPESSDDIKISLFFLNPIVHPTAVMRKNRVVEVGKYDPCFMRAQDYALWIKLFLKGYEFYNLQDKLIIYRNHEINITNSDLNNQLFYAERCLCDLYSIYLNKSNCKIVKIIREVLIGSTIKINIREFIMILILLKKTKLKMKNDKKIKDISCFYHISKIIIDKIKNEKNTFNKSIIDRLIQTTGLFK